MSLLSRSAVQAARGYGLLAGGNTISAEYLVVAGGGGGGSSSNAGGGGAGGMLTSVTSLSTLVTYSITVGAGGIGATTANNNGSQGANSIISGTGLSTITANGGGYGGHPAANGGNGGSGGGAGYAYTVSGGSGTAGQGNAGGRGAGSSTAPAYSAGGGGGAGGAGGNGTTSVGSGIGGAGLASSISGSSVTYAGGGAGGNDTTTVQAGGSGGGGNGAAANSTAATSGTANRGGGGGGGSSVITGGNGGSGIVIIAYTATSPKFVGGTITTSGGKQIHTFTSSGTLTPLVPVPASYLVVAGGGGSARQLGGYAGNGGGGAGGLQTGSTTIYSGGTYIVTVGAGGAGGTTSGVAPSGSNSVLSGTGLTTLTSTGGGGGGGSTGTGANGGSGGGGSGETPRTAGTGTSGQGNNGGAGVNAGGGGGGAGAAGSVAVTITGGAGGIGVQSSISGTATYYAGGGGGGGYGASGAAGAGGNGGGGNGGTNAGTALGGSGTANTGGGAGGTAGDPLGATNGASGGSGIVIISYAGSQKFNGGLVTTSGGNTIHTFTSSGALTPLTNNLTNSLRFRSSASAYLSRTPTIASNRKTWTLSMWFKLGALPTSDNNLYRSYSDAGANQIWVYFNSSNNNALNFGIRISSTNYQVQIAPIYRDPAAWYHLVYAVDTTQATSSNRAKIYINGQQVTDFISPSYPPQNSDTSTNNTGSHAFGSTVSGGGYFDGYMADINFIDGQALEPYYFGNNDANGVWKPILYKGTYGTNGYYLPFTTNSTTAYAGYSTDVSSIFNTLPTGSQGSNFTFTGDFTIEGWVLFPAANGDQSFYVNSDGTNYLALNINVSSGVYNIYCNSNSPTSSFSSGITVGNWTHVAMVRSGPTITLYTNGVPKGTIANSSTLGFSSLSLNRFGGGGLGARYLSNVRITKSAVYTSKFVPPTSALTNIANTVVLTYQNSSAIDNSSNAYTIGTTGAMSYPSGNLIFNANVISDASGNANNWTPNNLNYSTTGTTYDAMTDVPTNTSATVANYCTLNPLESFTNPAPQQANLYVPGTDYSQVKGTFWVSTGKWYFEWVSVGSNLPPYVGVSNASITSNTNVTTSGISWYGHSNSYYKNFTGTSLVGASVISVGDVIGVAFDCDAGTVAYYKNNTLVHTDTTLTPNQLVAPTLIGTFSGGSWSAAAFNFGQRPFAYTPPTGFVALNTFNLPTPTILQGNKYMDATLWTGNGSGQTVVNQSQFKPDFLWIKSRSDTYANCLNDSVRGVTKYLFSNLTNAESTVTDAVTSFNTNGFTLNTNVAVNGSTYTYVGWQWQAGQGTTSSGTGTGGITNVVQSVNTTAGFSIVTYTGSGANGTVTHGLGAALKMIIVKGRNTTSADHWRVYHSSLGATQIIMLNLTNAASTSSVYWNNTSPTSSVFSLGTDASLNENTKNFVAYCFAEIEGFSKFGSFTGNGSADGPFVYTGFRPKFLMFKTTTIIGHWVIVDTARNTYNVIDNSLYPDTSGSEINTITDVDFLSNGFKWRGVLANETNINGQVYIYAAFAEHPFKNANAR